jgi:hypothetical protein
MPDVARSFIYNVCMYLSSIYIIAVQLITPYNYYWVLEYWITIVLRVLQYTRTWYSLDLVSEPLIEAYYLVLHFYGCRESLSLY